MAVIALLVLGSVIGFLVGQRSNGEVRDSAPVPIVDSGAIKAKLADGLTLYPGGVLWMR